MAIPALSTAETNFVATLDGASNIPPSNASATGTAVLTLNDDQSQLSFTITYVGLSSPENGAHIHNAGPRDQGPIVFGLPLGTPKVGVWALSPTMVSELFAGRLYINIHTTDYIGGEIRGNIMTQVAAEASTWSRIKAMYR